MKQAWIWFVLFLIAMVICAYFLFKQLVMHQPIGSKPISNEGLIILSTIIPSFFVILYFVFRNTRLITKISSDGIHLRYFPYSKGEKIISYSDIKKFYKRKYRSYKEYGGYGFIREKPKRGSAMNVYGDTGIQLEMNTGKKMLIGTQRAEYFLTELRKASGRKE